MWKRLIQFLAGPEGPKMLAEGSRVKAQEILARHDIAAYKYRPDTACENKELGDAMRLLAAHGYIIADANGAIIGTVIKTTLTSDERAQRARMKFFVVER